MSTPPDQIDPDSPPQSALAQLQTDSPEGRAWASSYLKTHPQGVDTSGETALLQQQDADAEQARQVLRQAREKLAAQRMDPSVLGLRISQALLAPSKGGVPDQWSKAVGDIADWKQQNQAFQQQQNAEDLSLAQQLTGVDQQSQKARLALQELRERTGAQVLDTAIKASARPVVPQTAPHYALSEHDAQMPDGSPGKQMYLTETSSGKTVPYGQVVPTVKGAGLDSRSGIMFQRVLSSANEAASAIKNITELPTTVSTGLFGTGTGPGPSLLGSAKNALVNKLAPQEVQDYSTMLPGLGRNLATIETSGLAPQGSLTGSFDSLQLKEGDTGYTKLHKLAEYRQILEKGIETNLSNPKIPEEQKDAVRQIIAATQDAIPFTHHDVTALEKAHQTNPGLTLQDYLQSQGLGKKHVSASSSAGATPSKAVSLDGYLKSQGF